MANEMRDRLVELMEDIILSCKSSLCADCEHLNVGYPHCMGVHFADHLVANGVVCPPCKIGDTIYTVGFHTGQILESTVYAITFCSDDVLLLMENTTFVSVEQQLGKTVFLTKPEAEQKLKEMQT